MRLKRIKKSFIDQLTQDSSSFANEKQVRGFVALPNTVSIDITQKASGLSSKQTLINLIK